MRRLFRLISLLAMIALLAFSLWQPTNRSVSAGQGPGGEILRKPPPVNEATATRAEKATRSRKKVSVNDQVELAIKRGNAAGEESLKTLVQAESDYQHAAKLNPKDWRAAEGLASLRELLRYHFSLSGYRDWDPDIYEPSETLI